MVDLCSMNCSTCQAGAPTIKGDEISSYLDNLDLGWEGVEEKLIKRHFRFRNFKEALSFVNQVGEIAEQQGHHPDIYLGWGKVEISLTTHKAGGLTINDFIMASKIDKLSEINR